MYIKDNKLTFFNLQVNVANTSIELSRQNIYRFARILFPPNPEVKLYIIFIEIKY